jgi:hypothetical protein
MNVTLTLVPIAELVGYARNSNLHPAAQIDGLAASIDAFGLKGAIVLRDGVIAAGHGTLAACRQLLDAGQDIYPVPGRAAGAAPFPRGRLPANPGAPICAPIAQQGNGQ